MKIYVDNQSNIKALYSTEDAELIEYVVNREITFNDKTDNEILNYKYQEVSPNNFAIVPQKNKAKQALLNELAQLDRQIAESRALEDMIMGNPINQKVLDLIAQRQAKRTEYVALNNL